MCHCPKPVCTLYRIGYTYILQWDSNGKLLGTFPIQNNFFHWQHSSTERVWCVMVPNLFTHLFGKGEFVGTFLFWSLHRLQKVLAHLVICPASHIQNCDYFGSTFLGNGSTVLIRFFKTLGLK